MFRALLCSSSGGQIVLYSIWYRHTCRWPYDGHLQSVMIPAGEKRLTGLSPLCSCSLRTAQELWREKAFPDLSTLLQLATQELITFSEFIYL